MVSAKELEAFLADGPLVQLHLVPPAHGQGPVQEGQRTDCPLLDRDIENVLA